MTTQLLWQVISFLVGVSASFFVWWLTYHYWRPRVKFSEEMAEYILPSGESLFQSVIENNGKRDIIDLEIHVRIGIKGFLGVNQWAYHSVKSNASRVPVLSPGKMRRVRVFDTRDEIEFVDVPSRSIRDKIIACRSLRDVLALGTESSVMIHVFGYDSFSGSRKHYQSERYTKHSIRKGTFSGMNVVANKRFST